MSASASHNGEGTSTANIPPQPPSLPDDGQGSPDTPPHTVEVIPPDQLNVIKWRFALGVLLAALSIYYVAILLACSLWDAPTLADVTTIPPESTPLALGVLALHAVIVVAGVYFCYQLLLGGERLLMPFWVLNPGPYLGVQTPPQAARHQIAEVVKTILARPKGDAPKDGD